MMRTTISIDDDLIGQLMRLEPGVSRSEAMRRAVEAYIQRRRQEAFMDLAGSKLIDLDWREAEEQELEKLKRRDGGR